MGWEIRQWDRDRGEISAETPWIMLVWRRCCTTALKVRHCGSHCIACRRMHLEEKYFALFFSHNANLPCLHRVNVVEQFCVDSYNEEYFFTNARNVLQRKFLRKHIRLNLRKMSTFTRFFAARRFDKNFILRY